MVACAGMDDDQKTALYDLVGYSDPSDTPAENPPSASNGNHADFKYVSEIWLNVTHSGNYKDFLRALNVCGVVNVNNPYPGYYSVNIRFDPIHRTHRCDAWSDLVRLTEIYMKEDFRNDNLGGEEGVRGHVRLEVYFNDLARSTRIKVNGTFKWNRNHREGQESEILFSANDSNLNPLRSFGASIEKKFNSPRFRETGLNTWDHVSVRIENGRAPLGEVYFSNFISDSNSR